MKYGIDFRTFNTAIHGIMVYADRETAQSALHMLKQAEDVDNITYAEAVEIGRMLDTTEFKPLAVIEEIDYRLIKPVMKQLSYQVNNNGSVITEYDNVEIVNWNQFVDVF